MGIRQAEILAERGRLKYKMKKCIAVLPEMAFVLY